MDRLGLVGTRGDASQGKLHRRPRSLTRQDVYSLSMQIHDALDDGKSETCAVAIRVIGRGVEAIEYSGQVLRLDAAAGVDHPHSNDRRFNRHLHAHVASGRCVAQHVLKQIADDSLDQFDVAERGRAIHTEQRV